MNLLIDSEINIEGVRIDGAPRVPHYAHRQTAFNVYIGNAHTQVGGTTSAFGALWADIPSGADVLMTHSPPFGMLDRGPVGEHTGCRELAVAAQERARPRFHVFGHVHTDDGAIERDGTCYSSAAMVSYVDSLRGRSVLPRGLQQSTTEYASADIAIRRC